MSSSLARCWAASWSWVGHLLGRWGCRRGAPPPVIRDGVVEYRDNPIMDRLPAAAIVFGNVINYRPLPDPETYWVRRYDDFEGTAPLISLREHEFQHVLQYRRWGPAFVPAYLAAELAARLARAAGRAAVNLFERAADNGCAPHSRRDTLES